MDNKRITAVTKMTLPIAENLSDHNWAHPHYLTPANAVQKNVQIIPCPDLMHNVMLSLQQTIQIKLKYVSLIVGSKL